MHKYGESKTTRIMIATVRHVTSGYDLENFKPLHFCWTRFNIQQFYVLPTQFICVLCGSENKQLLFHYTALTDWLL